MREQTTKAIRVVGLNGTILLPGSINMYVNIILTYWAETRPQIAKGMKEMKVL